VPSDDAGCQLENNWQAQIGSLPVMERVAAVRGKGGHFGYHDPLFMIIRAALAVLILGQLITSSIFVHAVPIEAADVLSIVNSGDCFTLLGMALMRNGTLIVSCSVGPSAVLAIDGLVTRGVVSRGPDCTSVHALTVDDTSGALYFVCYSEDRDPLQAVLANGAQRSAPIPVCRNAVFIAFSPSSRSLYIVCGDYIRSVLMVSPGVVDAASWRQLTEIQDCMFPFGGALFSSASAADLLAVSCGGMSRALVVSNGSVIYQKVACAGAQAITANGTLFRACGSNSKIARVVLVNGVEQSETFINLNTTDLSYAAIVYSVLTDTLYVASATSIVRVDRDLNVTHLDYNPVCNAVAGSIKLVVGGGDNSGEGEGLYFGCNGSGVKAIIPPSVRRVITGDIDCAGNPRRLTMSRTGLLLAFCRYVARNAVLTAKNVRNLSVPTSYYYEVLNRTAPFCSLQDAVLSDDGKSLFVSCSDPFNSGAFQVLALQLGDTPSTVLSVNSIMNDSYCTAVVLTVSADSTLAAGCREDTSVVLVRNVLLPNARSFQKVFAFGCLNSDPVFAALQVSNGGNVVYYSCKGTNFTVYQFQAVFNVTQPMVSRNECVEPSALYLHAGNSNLYAFCAHPSEFNAVISVDTRSMVVTAIVPRSMCSAPGSIAVSPAGVLYVTCLEGLLSIGLAPESGASGTLRYLSAASGSVAVDSLTGIPYVAEGSGDIVSLQFSCGHVPGMQVNYGQCGACAPGRSRSYGSTFNSSLRGSMNCEICSPGTVMPNTGGTACTACSAGHYSGPDNVPAMTCFACARGTSANASMATTCDPCPRGYKADAIHSERCSPCSAGFYASLPGSVECIPCPEVRALNSAAVSNLTLVQ